MQTAQVLYVNLAFPSTPIGCQIRPMVMALCKLCQKISRQDWQIVPLKPEGEWLQHHQTYGNLCKSALEGWELCIVLKNGPLDWAGTHANKLYKWRKRASSASGVGRRPDSYLLKEDTSYSKAFFVVQHQTYPGDGPGYSV